MSETFLIGRGEAEVALLPRMANRHGLIAGATGTGKTRLPIFSLGSLGKVLFLGSG